MSRSLLPAPRPIHFDIPLFLAPAFYQQQAQLSVANRPRTFSTSPFHCKKGVLLGRGSREKNKKRGVSAIRSTGPRVRSQVYKFDLPQPNLDPNRRKEFKTNPQHGLWGFFNEAKKAMVPPEDEIAFGRSWTYQELSIKSFADLHRLWYTCMLERNRTMTRKREMGRIHAGWGDYEAESRIQSIRATMSRIRRVLADRQLNWLEAQTLLKSKPLSELLPDEEQDANQSDLDNFMDDPLAPPSAKEDSTAQQDGGVSLDPAATEASERPSDSRQRITQ